MSLQAKFQKARSLQRLGQFTQAKAVYQGILALQPKQLDTLVALGILVGQSGDFLGALQYFDRALSIDRTNAVVHCNRGLALQELRRPQEAIESYDAAIAHRADHAVAYFNRAVLLEQLGHDQAALRDYDRAIAIDGRFVQAHFNRGVLLQARKDAQSALASYDKALALKGDHVDAWINRGIVLRELGELDAALASHDRALDLHPGNARALCNRGVTQLSRGDTSAALDSYDRAIRIEPNHVQSFLNRGLLLATLQRWYEARSDYDRAVELAPEMAAAYSGRGLVLDSLGQTSEALSDYDRALTVQPDFAQARFNKSLTLLSLGHFADGWREHEWRWRSELTSSAKERRTFAEPLWLGQEIIEAKTILLHAEQGLGDTLQFCRYASLVAERGARVLLEVQRPLTGLMTRLPGISRVLAKGDPLPPFDYQCPLMSLPLAFGTHIDTIPARRGYLSASEERVAKLMDKLGAKAKPRVGLAWSGSATHANDCNRSLALADLSRCLPAEFQYFCLQKDCRPSDEPFLNSIPGLEVLLEELSNFDDTAALCDCMDLIISVDTSLAHLSAGLGKTTWLLLSAVADWRWLRGRTDSPWYPTVTVFRQKTPGDWSGVLEEVNAALRRLSLEPAS